MPLNSASTAVVSPDFLSRLAKLHRQLGIPAGFADSRHWDPQPEPLELVDAGLDFYGRPQRLTPATLLAWQAMQLAAAEQNISLWLISAFRSVDYQCELIAKKLAKGLIIEDILTVNAAPGYSEHHTGRAIDIGTSDCLALEEEFETTPAFHWLQTHAAQFGFSLSYPRNNPAGICYEPWHWCFKPSGTP